MNIPVEFKTVEIENEIDIILPRTRSMLFEFAYFSYSHFGKIAIVTGLMRTMEQQQRIYKQKIKQGYFVKQNGKKLYSTNGKTPTISVHQVGRGIDIRSTIYTYDEKEKILYYFNDYFPYGKKLYSILLHNVGDGEHFHIQTAFREEDSLFDYSKYIKI